MKKILTYLTVLILIVIQTLPGRYISIFGVLPNLALTFTIIYALTNSPVRSACLGFFCGLLFDSTTGGAFGFCTLCVMYLCLGASYFFRLYYYENKLAVAWGVFCFTVLYEVIVYVFTIVLYAEAPFFYGFVRYILPEAALNSVISVPLLMLVKWLNDEYIRGI